MPTTILFSGSVTQGGRVPSHTGITGDGLAHAAAKLAAGGTPSDGFPLSPSTKLSAISSLPKYSHTSLPDEAGPTSRATPIGTTQTQGFARCV